ncbi:MAG: serpin family protein [Verrucomicrobia bacterium]|nr:serpin family protein [Verrucomicrobiota bacterium]
MNELTHPLTNISTTSPQKSWRAPAIATMLAAVVIATPANAEMTNPPPSLMAGNIAFALDLYQQLKASEGNLFFSPHSLSAALAMTYTGARGQTEEEMAKTLHFNLPPSKLPAAFGALDRRLAEIGSEKQVALKVANSLWAQSDYSFTESFLNLNRRHFGAEVALVDFARQTESTRRQINSWVAGKTADKITEVVAPGVLSPMTRLVLCNAIYFKGDWARRFDPSATKEADFYAAHQRIVKVPLMYQRLNLKGRELKDGLSLFELPYQGGALSMIVLLPKAKDGLGALESRLTQENLDRWLAELAQSREAKAQVFLPRFKLSSLFALEKTLAEMGMASAFGAGADFSGMTGKRDLAISAVAHQAVVEVNEQGTEAAAATAVFVERTSISPMQVFRADHPFMFLIRENQTGSMLFLGRVMDPRKS